MVRKVLEVDKAQEFFGVGWARGNEKLGYPNNMASSKMFSKQEVTEELGKIDSPKNFLTPHTDPGSG